MKHRLYSKLNSREIMKINKNRASIIYEVSTMITFEKIKMLD